MDAIVSGNESDDEPIYTKMLEDVKDDSKSHPNINRREACWKNVIALNEPRRNGNDCYYLCKSWIKLYKKCLKMS